MAPESSTTELGRAVQDVTELDKGKDLLAFTKRLIKLRQEHYAFRRTRFLRGELSPSRYPEHVAGVVDMLVDGWDSSRGIVRSGYPILSPAAKRDLLAELAAGAPVREEALAAIAEQTGLLERDPAGRWAFADDSVSAYFEAVSLLSSGRGGALPRQDVAGFLGFLAGDGSDRFGALSPGPEALDRAAALTEMLGQCLAPAPAARGSRPRSGRPASPRCCSCWRG